MNAFVKIIEFLKKPYPEDEDRYAYFNYLLAISLFVAFFLFVFEPFGLSDLESHKLLICLGFGAMTFLGSVVYELTVGKLLSILGVRENWTFGKWLLNNLGIMFFISLANFLFVRLTLFGFIQWELFPVMLYGTLMIGLIPFTVLGGLSLLKQERKYQDIAQEINQKKTATSAPPSSEIGVFDIPVYQIKYVEALQNYIKIGYVDEEGKLQEQTERSTLKGVLELTEGSAIVKCHRSFLVNKDAVTSTAGNAQGLLLSLSDCDKVIPVSRSCVADFR